MPTYKNYLTYNKFSKPIIILLQALALLFVTSCSSIDHSTNNMLVTPTQEKNKLKKLIVPEEINTPNTNQNYDVPYNKDDLNQKKQSVFPPVKYFV